jgi:hypothetical protein
MKVIFMKYLSGILLFITLAFVATNVMASKEGILIWSIFSVESRGIDTSGPIKVFGNQTQDGIVNFEINAFHRKIAFNPSQIAQLHGFIVNGMRLSYEQGYKEAGGNTLYITISKGFTSGGEIKKIIKITEQGNISIGATIQTENKSQ